MKSSSQVSTQGLRKVVLVVLVIGLVAAAVAAVMRIRAEASSRAVELVVDYDEVAGLASLEGASIDNILGEMRNAGATAVALPEDTLTTLINQGQVTLIKAPPFFTGRFLNGDDTDPVFSIETTNMAVNTRVADALKQAYLPENIIVEAPARILVRGSEEMVSDIGLGLSRMKVERIANRNLRVVPRLHAGLFSTPRSVQASVGSALMTLGPDLNDGKPRGIMIFDGDTIPGYRELLPGLAQRLKQQRMVFGSIEFGKQKGDTELGKELDGYLVRVHSIAPAELATMSPAQAAQRFALAVKDRNIRVIYVRFPPMAHTKQLQSAKEYVNLIATTIRQDGFVISHDPNKMAHPFIPLHVPALLLAAIFAGAVAGILLWMVGILPTALPRSLVWTGYALLILGVLGAVIAAFVPSLTGPGRLLFGLLAAIGFPMLALTQAYRFLNRLDERRPGRVLLPAILALVGVTGLTVLGGLLVAGMMAESRYLVKVTQFSGVKIALAVPLLLFALLLVTDGVAHIGENLSEYLARIGKRLRGFSEQPLYMWGVAVAVVALVAVVVLMMRSGNEGMEVSNLELRFRAILEQWMVARPRTKEFAFGHPLFLFSMIAGARGQRTVALLLLLGGAIGQVDVLNTYCHAHTPLTLSLLRTFNGLWVGIGIGVLLLLVFARHALSSRALAKAGAQGVSDSSSAMDR